MKLIRVIIQWWFGLDVTWAFDSPVHGNETRLLLDLIKFESSAIISAVKSVSEQVGRSMAQVALAWLRYRTVPA